MVKYDEKGRQANECIYLVRSLCIQFPELLDSVEGSSQIHGNRGTAAVFLF